MRSIRPANSQGSLRPPYARRRRVGPDLERAHGPEWDRIALKNVFGGIAIAFSHHD